VDKMASIQDKAILSSIMLIVVTVMMAVVIQM
jgi:hypothetical protein